MVEEGSVGDEVFLTTIVLIVPFTKFSRISSVCFIPGGGATRRGTGRAAIIIRCTSGGRVPSECPSRRMSGRHSMSRCGQHFGCREDRDVDGGTSSIVSRRIVPCRRSCICSGQLLQFGAPAVKITMDDPLC